MDNPNQVDSIRERKVEQENLFEASGERKPPHSLQFDPANEELVTCFRLPSEHVGRAFHGSQKPVCGFDTGILGVPHPLLE